MFLVLCSLSGVDCHLLQLKPRVAVNCLAHQWLLGIAPAGLCSTTPVCIAELRTSEMYHGSNLIGYGLRMLIVCNCLLLYRRYAITTPADELARAPVFTNAEDTIHLFFGRQTFSLLLSLIYLLFLLLERLHMEREKVTQSD